jgi:hypothetical protein
MTATTGPDMSPEAERLRHELADRLDVYPAREWSPAMTRVMISLLDLYIDGEVHDALAPVLTLVRKPPGPPA